MTNLINLKDNNKKVIITGATGFIGQHLVPLFLEKNYDVTVLIRDKQKAKKFQWFQEVRLITFDMEQSDFEFSVDHGSGLIHLAWDGLPNYKSNFHLEQNLPLSYRFIKSVIKKDINQVLVTGTCFEYGLKNGAIKSNLKTSPINQYGLAKDVLHKKLRSLSYEHNYILQWARLFYMYGKGQNSSSLLPQLDSAIDKNEKVFNMSGGKQLRDFLPIETVAEQIFELYVSKKNGTFNVCSGKPISVKGLAQTKIKERGSSIKLNLGFYPYPDHEPMEFWGVRDIGQTIHLPVLPNAPLEKSNRKQSLGPVRLRFNTSLNFLENEAFDPKLIDYTENYENSQINSERFSNHMKSVLKILKKKFPRNSNIIEVGCGKGDFLQMVQNDNHFKIKGYDASYDGNNESIEKRYLNNKDRIKTDLVILRHVLEHVPNPYNFLNLLKKIFGEVMVYIEVPSYDWILEKKTFFDITYEHVNYFSQKSLKTLFTDKSLQHRLLFDDQYQFVMANLKTLNRKFENDYNSKNWKPIYFDELFPNLKNDIENLEKISKNKNIFLWGAATKGCLFLVHCMNHKSLIKKIKFAIDQNPKKIGKYLPVSGVQIKTKQDFFKTAKEGDLLIISNPAYQEEICSDLKAAGLENIIIKTH